MSGGIKIGDKLPLKWTDNYWVKEFKNGDKVKVMQLSDSDLYHGGMKNTVGKIGEVVDDKATSSKHGELVGVVFGGYERWYYYKKDLQKVF